MAALRIEHINVTVSSPERAADLMEQIFDWQVRWRGPGRDGGRTIHVGSADHYVAFYANPDSAGTGTPFEKGVPLNHIGVEVDDIEMTEGRVVEAGLVPFSHGDYEPGQRFYFFDPDGIEYEVVSYA